MADKSDDKDKGKGEGNGAPPATGNISDVLEKLKGFSPPIVLPDDTTPANFYDRLCTALGAITAAQGGAPADADLDDAAAGDMGGAPAGETDAPPPPLAMSFVNRLLGKERQELGQRIHSLFSTGRINKPVYQKLKEELTAVKLSLNPTTGELKPNKLTNRIEAYEQLDAGSAHAGRKAPAVGLSFVETDVPLPYGHESEEAARKRQEEAGDELAALAGAPVKK